MALRICIGVPRTETSRHTLTEAGLNLVKNALQEVALGHLIRMSNCDSTILLLIKIAERAESKRGAHLCTLGDMAGTPGPLIPLLALHREPHPLRLTSAFHGMRSNKNTAAVAVRQLTEDDLSI